MVRMAQNDVVEHFDFEKLAGANQVTRDLNVGFGRCGVPAYAVCDISGVIPRPVLCRRPRDLPDFHRVNSSPMRHKTAALLQPFEIAQQLVVGPVSAWLALRWIHLVKDGLL
jgi:hypothetical protein